MQGVHRRIVVSLFNAALLGVAVAALAGSLSAAVRDLGVPDFAGIDLTGAAAGSCRALAPSTSASAVSTSDRSLPRASCATGPELNPAAPLFRAGNRKGGEVADFYYDTIQPIIARRCTVCHGCENSPCSLKLVSYQGLQRGGTQIASQTSLAVKGFQAIRLKDGPQQASNAEWKAAWQVSRPANQRFNPVAPEVEQGGRGAEQSLLYQFLKQGNEINRPGFDRAPVRRLEQARYDGGATQCVANTAEFGTWRTEHPEGGMPFGCPGLKRLSEGGHGAGEFDTMEAWIKKGAPGPTQEAVTERLRSKSPATVARWEQYLNQPTTKQRLVSRFLFEHLFRAHIHFDSAPGEFYELVRASNPPGRHPVLELVTFSPNDAPTGQKPGEPMYYRLRKMTDLVTIKDHIVWEADSRKLERIKYLFDQEAPRWSVSTLPGYEGKNPFLYFQAIPASLRYKFLLENSRYVLENLTRSPVCNGSKATFAMDDYVWAWFLVPGADPTAQDAGPAAFGAPEWELVNDGYRVNAEYLKGSNALAKHNERYLTELEQRQRILRPDGLKVDDIWDGTCLYQPQSGPAGKDANAWVSALRHETNASVLLGGEGGKPISVWLFNFTNLERAYYSLSFNYQEWGSIQHKLLTFRDFMHVRIEAQDRFLSLLDPTTRTAIRRDWSSGWLGELGLALFPDRSLGREGALTDLRQAVAGLVPGDAATGLAGARPGDPTLSIAAGLPPREAFLSGVDQIARRRFTEPSAAPSSINRDGTPSARGDVTTREALEDVMRLATQKLGFFNSRLASVSYVRVMPEGWVYSMVAHRRYAAHNSIADTAWARRGQSAYDYSSIYRGIVGDYPNAFFDVPLARAREFFERLVTVRTDAEWLKLRDEFIVRKNGDEFWRTVDWYHDWIAENMPVTGGIVDLREYDNWEVPPESQGN